MNINTEKNDKYTKYARKYPAIAAMLLPSMALTHYLYNLEIFKELFKVSSINSIYPLVSDSRTL